MNQPPIPSAVRTMPERAVHAIGEFFRLESAGGILLVAAAVLALACANSPLEEFYDGFRELPVAVVFGVVEVAKPLLLWINDGLMAVFFLLVALEIKREAIGGQLAERRKLLMPLLCAGAGVAVPALVFSAINRGDPLAMQGWAVPAATDIAFALGVLSLLGSRVPMGMKLLLSTIAVVDDLAAILIIAVFYSHGLSPLALGGAGIAVAVMALLNRRGVRALTPYLLLGAVTWVCVLKSGVHATLAGVVTGLLIPYTPDPADPADAGAPAPLERLEQALHPWVAYGILPVFAFANAGLALGDFRIESLLQPLPMGIALGLLLGKPVGVIGAALLARALRIADFPDGMDTRSIIGLGLLCGIGFTMSLFIASLAFANAGDLAYSSVLGVLTGSVLAAVAGYLWLRVVLPRSDAVPRNG
jgi:NhaA family Na+:H+ antiporter